MDQLSRDGRYLHFIQILVTSVWQDGSSLMSSTLCTFASIALRYRGPHCGYGTSWQYADIQTRPPFQRGGAVAVDEILNTQDYVVTIITRQ